MHKEDRFQNDLSTTYDYDGRFMGEKRRKRPRCILILEYFSKYGRESMELDIGRAFFQSHEIRPRTNSFESICGESAIIHSVL